MASQTSQRALLRFRGAPTLLEGLAPLAFQKVTTAQMSLELKLPRAAEAERPINWQAEPVGATATFLRFSLPDATPPGTYEGVVQCGDERFAAIIEVVPQPQLVVSPRQLTIDVAPDVEPAATLTVVNTGNVACELPKAHAFGIFDVEGLERGIGAALRDPTAKMLDRVSRLANEVTESHGGLVRVRMPEGAGTLAPGELRHVRVAFSFSDRLRSGRTYSGTWPLLNLTYQIVFRITGQTPYEPDKPNRPSTKEIPR